MNALFEDGEIALYELDLKSSKNNMLRRSSGTPLQEDLARELHWESGKFFALLPKGISSSDLAMLIDSGLKSWPLDGGSSALGDKMPRTDGSMAKLLLKILIRECNPQHPPVIVVEDTVTSKTEYLEDCQRYEKLSNLKKRGIDLLLKGLVGHWPNGLLLNQSVYCLFDVREVAPTCANVSRFLGSTHFVSDNIGLISAFQRDPVDKRISRDDLTHFVRNAQLIFVPALAETSYLIWARKGVLLQT